MVGIDFVGPLQSIARGNCTTLTITDLFSKWTEAYALPDKRASSVASALVNLIRNKGIPRAVLSDNGSEFCNEIRKLLMNVMRRSFTLKCSSKSAFYKNVFSRILSTILHQIKVGTILKRRKFMRPFSYFRNPRHFTLRDLD